MKNGLITEINKPKNEYMHKFRKLFRGSHINPLLCKIELLMGEIDLDKKYFRIWYFFKGFLYFNVFKI